MPQDAEGLDVPNTLIEYRGIRGGERGEKAPIKTPPRVRQPLRNLETKKFDIDEDVMKAAAKRLGVKSWARDVDAIPVYLLSDKIVGDEGVVYLERALYTGRGRLCSSAAGVEKASQKVDVKAYAASKGKSKTIKELKVVREVDCNSDCPLWGTPEKPTDCKWRAIVNVQLMDSTVFPSPTRHRTRSKYSIRAMVTSLRHISAITNGVLMGIPLFFRQVKIEVKDREGKTRRIPIMVFEFDGTVQELREHAAREIASRISLVHAADGVLVPKSDIKRSLYDGGVVVDGEIIEDEAEDKADDIDEGAVEALVKKEDNDLSSEVAVLYKRMRFTPARQRMVEDKHGGDLAAVLEELRGQAPEDFNPAPGEPGEDSEASETEAETENPDDDEEEGAVSDDDFDDLFD
jgi:hypothetical protein